VKLLLDANLSPEVRRRLQEAGHDAIHVADVGLLTATDPVILQAAAKDERILLTADSDFGHCWPWAPWRRRQSCSCAPLTICAQASKQS
jgi:predicted nuclease of predicted toxin-antitoxin system